MENTETVACPHCLKEFTKRGMPKHLSACKKKNDLPNPQPAVIVAEPIVPVVPAIPAIPDIIRITKTDAKKKYALTDRDLQNIPHITKQNPRYRSAPPMCLYDEEDLIEYAERKHDGLDKLEEKKQKNAERAIRANQTKANARNTRRNHLKQKLEQNGCNLRGDSRLCNSYIDDGEGDVDEIVQVMCEMQFYYNHTRYPSILEQKLSNARDERREYGFYYDYDEISEDAKMSALIDFCNKYASVDDLPLTVVPNSLKQICRNYVELRKNQQKDANVVDEKLSKSQKQRKQRKEKRANEELMHDAGYQSVLYEYEDGDDYDDDPYCFSKYC